MVTAERLNECAMPIKKVPVGITSNSKREFLRKGEKRNLKLIFVTCL
jgi:hypothetical protein